MAVSSDVCLRSEDEKQSSPAPDRDHKRLMKRFDAFRDQVVMATKKVWQSALSWWRSPLVAIPGFTQLTLPFNFYSTFTHDGLRYKFVIDFNLGMKEGNVYGMAFDLFIQNFFERGDAGVCHLAISRFI